MKHYNNAYLNVIIISLNIINYIVLIVNANTNLILAIEKYVQTHVK